MHIDNMYRYTDANGIICVSSFLPEGAVLVERLNILCADAGYELENIHTGERVQSVLLSDTVLVSDYREVF